MVKVNNSTDKNNCTKDWEKLKDVFTSYPKNDEKNEERLLQVGVFRPGKEADPQAAPLPKFERSVFDMKYQEQHKHKFQRFGVNPSIRHMKYNKSVSGMETQNICFQFLPFLFFFVLAYEIFSGPVFPSSLWCATWRPSTSIFGQNLGNM